MSACWHYLLAGLRDTHNWLLVGLALLLGHLGGKIANRFRMPSVVGYLLVGVLLGCSVSGMVDEATAEALGPVAAFGLGIVAFTIGSEMSWPLLKRTGRGLAILLLATSFGAVLAVFMLLWLLGGWLLPHRGLALPAALVFGAIAATTAPAGTVAVIREARAKGPMTSILLAVVGLDDAVGIIVYAFAAACAGFILGGRLSAPAMLAGPVLEIFGSLLIGGLVGTALTAVISRTESRAEILSLVLGGVLLVTGIAGALHVSLILANMAVGVALANLSPRAGERAFAAIERVSHPVFILFFVVAGVHLDLRVLSAAGFLVPVYILGRTGGKLLGAYAGVAAARMERRWRLPMGLGLLSQAGVAVGLALLAARTFTQYGEAGRLLASLVINSIAASTVFFEIIGPIAAKIALLRVYEVGARPDTGDEE